MKGYERDILACHHSPPFLFHHDIFHLTEEHFPDIFHSMTGRFKDLSGQKIGALLVINRVGSEKQANGTSYATWRCHCECGRDAVVSTRFLIKRKKPDCGNHGRAKKHGQSGNGTDIRPSPTYSSWRNMIARCTQKSNPAYEHYKKRGITVCERWRKFENFLSDMGERPDNTTLDRIDNDKGYDPENCRWATKQEQGNNRITNLHFTYKGEEYTLSGLARHTGVSKETLRVRLVRPGGWSVKDAVETPVIPRHLRKAGLSKRNS